MVHYLSRTRRLDSDPACTHLLSSVDRARVFETLRQRFKSVRGYQWRTGINFREAGPRRTDARYVSSGPESLVAISSASGGRTGSRGRICVFFVHKPLTHMYLVRDSESGKYMGFDDQPTVYWSEKAAKFAIERQQSRRQEPKIDWKIVAVALPGG